MMISWKKYKTPNPQTNIHKTPADYGSKRSVRETDSSLSSFDDSSTYLNWRILSLTHVVWPVIIYILAMWQKHLLILARTEEIIPDYKFLLSFSFQQQYLSNKLAFSAINPQHISCWKHFWLVLIPSFLFRYSPGHRANPRWDSAGQGILLCSP